MRNPLKRRRYMITPGLAGGYESARDTARRKSIFMVEYLRARRMMRDIHLPEYRRTAEARMMAFFRRKHFELKSQERKQHGKDHD